MKHSRWVMPIVLSASLTATLSVVPLATASDSATASATELHQQKGCNGILTNVMNMTQDAFGAVNQDFKQRVEKIKTRYADKMTPEQQVRLDESVEIIVSYSVLKDDGQAQIDSANQSLEKRAAKSECSLDELEDIVVSKRDRYQAKVEVVITQIEERFDLEFLDDDEGLVVLSAYVYGPKSVLEIIPERAFSFDMEIGPFQSNEYFKVVKMPAGDYRWGKAKQRFFGGYRYHDFSDNDYTFSVTAGKLNYVGSFIYINDWTGYARGDLHDRLSINLSKLESDYPMLLEQKELHNGLVAHDPFLDFYLNEKQQKQSAKEAE